MGFRSSVDLSLFCNVERTSRNLLRMMAMEVRVMIRGMGVRVLYSFTGTCISHALCTYYACKAIIFAIYHSELRYFKMMGLYYSNSSRERRFLNLLSL